MHLCAKDEYIIINYDIEITRTLDIWLESDKPLYLISYFVKDLFEQLSKFKFIIFHGN